MSDVPQINVNVVDGLPEAPQDDITYGRRNAAWVDMTAPAQLVLRQGTAAEVAAITPLEGEPVWATDTKRLVVGDGVTGGGVPVGGFPLEGTAAGAPSPQQQTPPVGNVFAAAGVEVRGLSGQNPTFVAGDARGKGAVDLQMRRTAGTQVASGDYSTILGGFHNTASGIGSLAFGFSAIASGVSSVAINGTSDRADMWSFGIQTSSVFQSNVRAQEVGFTRVRLTTNATPASVSVAIPSGVALACTVEVFGVKTSDAANAAHYIRKAAIRNVGGTTQLMGSVTTVGTDYESDAGLDVAITADDGNDTLKIEVTGLVSTSIRWIIVVRGVELAL
jgi:hypothetical protein